MMNLGKIILLCGEMRFLCSFDRSAVNLSKLKIISNYRVLRIHYYYIR